MPQTAEVWIFTMLQLYRTGQVKQAALTATGTAGCAAGKAMLLESAVCTVLLLNLPRSSCPSGVVMTQDLPRAFQRGFELPSACMRTMMSLPRMGWAVGRGNFAVWSPCPCKNARQKKPLQNLSLDVSPADRPLTLLNHCVWGVQATGAGIRCT